MSSPATHHLQRGTKMRRKKESLPTTYHQKNFFQMQLHGEEAAQFISFFGNRKIDTLPSILYTSLSTRGQPQGRKIPQSWRPRNAVQRHRRGRGTLSTSAMVRAGLPAFLKAHIRFLVTHCCHPRNRRRCGFYNLSLLATDFLFFFLPHTPQFFIWCVFGRHHHGLPSGPRRLRGIPSIPSSGYRGVSEVSRRPAAPWFLASCLRGLLSPALSAFRTFTETCVSRTASQKRLVICASRATSIRRNARRDVIGGGMLPPPLWKRAWKSTWGDLLYIFLIFNINMNDEDVFWWWVHLHKDPKGKASDIACIGPNV